MNENKQPTVLVTGATGFIGRVLIKRLLEMGCGVRVFARTTSNLSAFEGRPVDVHIGDLGDAASVVAAAQGSDVIVHAAGGGQALSVAGLRGMNVDTTRAVRDAAVAHSCRVVFVSSFAAAGPLDQDRGSHIGPVSNYGRAKREAEELLLNVADRVHVTVLRPPAIYGPGDHRMLPVFRSASRGVIVLPGPARRAAFMHVEDCAAAIALAACSTDRDSGAVIAVSGGRASYTTEAMATIAAALGRRARIVRIPVFVLRVIATANEGIAQLRRRPVLLSRDKVRELAQRYWDADDEDMQSVLGFTPGVSLARGFEDTARWYRQEGLL